MYADVESRGGILEPPGICEVKFRAADQVSKMHEVRGEGTDSERLGVERVLSPPKTVSKPVLDLSISVHPQRVHTHFQVYLNVPEAQR